MNLSHISIFNLIEIFRQAKRPVPNTVSPKTHCAERHHHDFYCDAEKPDVQ